MPAHPADQRTSTAESSGPDLFRVSPAGISDETRPGLWASVPEALRMWDLRQWLGALGITVIVGLFMGLSTVLIPNALFGRKIASEPWNYPVWIIVSMLTGMLGATYLRTGGVDAESGTATAADESTEVRPARFGTVGAMLGWFAVGCPVCNKIALLALGYSGALRWFAPAQPFLAVAAIGLSSVALAMRLRGQLWCPAPRSASPPRC